MKKSTIIYFPPNNPILSKAAAELCTYGEIIALPMNELVAPPRPSPPAQSLAPTVTV